MPKTNEFIFSAVYRLNAWGFGSGHGSLPQYTTPYREFLQRFMLENAVQSVVDFGCGDWQFSRLMDWSKVDYLGLDIVKHVITCNQAKYGSDRIRFALAPSSFSDMEGCDLLIVKDVLQHLPSTVIHEFMDQVVSRFRHTLITNCVEPASCLNSEISAGRFRPLDLRLAPFSYPAPAILSFSGPNTFSLRSCRMYPAWRKLVLHYQCANSPSSL